MDNERNRKGEHKITTIKSIEPNGQHSLDSLLQSLGQCGRFQIFLVGFGYYPLLPAAWALIFMAFGSYNPGWVCLNSSTPGNVTYSNIHLHNNSNEILQRNLSFHEETIRSACAARKTCQEITFTGTTSTVVTEWSLVCDQSWAVSFITSGQMIAVLLGSCLGGFLGEKMGRRFCIHGGAALLALSNLVIIFSNSWQVYAGLNAVMGLACGTILSSTTVYTCEFIPARWRVIVGVFPFWNLATFFFSLCVFLLRQWKLVHLVLALLSALAFIPVFWLPESMRHLTVHGKLQKAHKVARRIAKLNNKPNPNISLIEMIAETERKSLKSRMNYTYLDLFRGRIRKFALVLGGTWFILSLGYFMIGFGLRELSGDFYINLILFSSLPAPARIASMILASRVGRKVAASIFICLAGLCALSVALVQLFAPKEKRDTPTLVLALAISMAVEGAWGVTAVLIVELMPTGVRNLAYGFCNSLARLGSILAPYLIPRANLPVHGAFLLLAGLLGLCFLGVLTLPETRHRPLPDSFTSPDGVAAKRLEDTENELSVPETYIKT